MAKPNTKQKIDLKPDNFKSRRANTNASEVLPKILLYNGLLVGLVLVNMHLLDPLLRYLFPFLTISYSVIYLPFAIKLMVGFFEGFRAPFYLMPGALFIDIYLFNGGAADAISHHRIIAVMFCYSLPPIAFAITDWLLMINRRVDFTHPGTWRSLYVAGFMSSILCALTLYSTHDLFTFQEGVRTTASFVFGDLMGLTAMLLLGLVSIKTYTRWQHH